MKIPRFIHLLGSPPWFYQFSGRVVPWLAIVSVACLLTAWVWGLAFAPEDAKQGNSFRIIYLHVPTAFISLAGYYFMAFFGAVFLIWRIKLMAIMMTSAALIGAIMTAISLFTGAIWGKPTWGTWWVWDARITSMLILFFLYLGVIGLQQAFTGSKASVQTGHKAAAILALVGTINVPIIYKSVDWWFSLHQPATIKLTQAPSMDPLMFRPLLLAIIGIYLFYLLLLLWRTRVDLLASERDKSWVKEIAQALN